MIYKFHLSVIFFVLDLTFWAVYVTLFFTSIHEIDTKKPSKHHVLNFKLFVKMLSIFDLLLINIIYTYLHAL